MRVREFTPKRTVGRRAVIISGAATLAVMATARKAAASANIIDVTAPPYNASPNLPDNTENFQSALNALALSGGGVLMVPPGYYAFQGPLNYSAASGSLTIIGYGSELSILMIRHTSTALCVTFTNPGDSQGLVVKNIGFSPAPPPAPPAQPSRSALHRSHRHGPPARSRMSTSAHSRQATPCSARR